MYIAYIYDINNTIVAQIDEILDFEVSNKINGVSTSSWSLYHTNDYCTREYIKEYRRTKINIKQWNIEKTMFDGVIRWFDADITKTTIKCESFEHYFERRLLVQDYTLNDSINNILTDILVDINNTFQTNITLDCLVTATTTKQYKRGETYLKVLQDMAGLWYEFIIVDKILYFKQTVGIDRTTGVDFIQYKYDINEPDDRSINNVKMSVDGKDLANGVLAKAGAGYTYLQDTTSMTEFWLIETSFSNSWDNVNGSQSYLDDHKASLSEFDVDVISLDFFEAWLWDLVSVYIFVGNDVLFFNWSMKVTQKKYTSGDLPKIQFKLWVSVVKNKDFIEQFVEIQQRLKTIELQ